MPIFGQPLNSVLVGCCVPSPIRFDIFPAFKKLSKAEMSVVMVLPMSYKPEPALPNAKTMREWECCGIEVHTDHISDRLVTCHPWDVTWKVLVGLDGVEKGSQVRALSTVDRLIGSRTGGTDPACNLIEFLDESCLDRTLCCVETSQWCCPSIGLLTGNVASLLHTHPAIAWWHRPSREQTCA